MKFNYRKSFIFFAFLILSFFTNNIDIKAEKVCTYENELELIFKDGKVKVHANGFEVKDYEIYFDLSEDSKCPEKIYELIGAFSLYDSEPKSGTNWEVYKLIKTESVNRGNKVNCGNITEIPSKLPKLTSKIITIIQVAVPVILVIMGSIDLFKGITAQKEEEIKKGQQIFIKRLIYAALIFFVVVIVKFLVSLVDDNVDIADCIDCFINYEC